MTTPSTETFHILGVPLRAGSFYPGTENDAQAFRDVRLADRLQSAGCQVVDEGDVEIPSYLPHHALPPIRNWPAPRVVWDLVGERIAPLLRAGHVPLLIGCDCSIVVGTAQAVAAAGGDVHVLYLDGDLDDAPPTADRSVSAAAAAVWLLTHDSPFSVGPALDPSRVTVIGCDSVNASIPAVPVAEVRRLGPAAAARQALDALPSSASVVLHFDIDVVRHEELPAAYFPHADGLGASEVRELLGTFLADQRIRLVEVTEYASLRDGDRRLATQLAGLLAATLRR